jgi:hypothetical protein
LLERGATAPGFSLPAPDGRLHGLGDAAAAYLVMFICNHCPYVKHVPAELTRLGNDYLPRKVLLVATNF